MRVCVWDWPVKVSTFYYQQADLPSSFCDVAALSVSVAGYNS